jgi:signal transduction histidine kinase
MQKEFRSIVAHELRNSVTPILGLAEIIEARLLENKNGKIELKGQEFEIITRSAKKITTTCNKYVRFNITELKAHLEY